VGGLLYADNESCNVWESLPEAIMERGKRDGAMRYYEHSLSIIPPIVNAQLMTQRLLVYA
jgi:hypothetical protein